jgi:hypothetical protein
MAPAVVFTVGRSTRGIDAFLHLLRHPGIQRVIDVRASWVLDHPHASAPCTTISA